MITVVTVVGARPQFIKAAVVSRAIDQWNDTHPQRRVAEILVHTGQHYDDNMSAVFFDELSIRPPAVNLEMGGGRHGEMTGRMLAGIEALVIEHKADWVLVYGDTNSTLAGALAAAKLHIPVAHVEAGLRSFNRRMPEEINRVLTDHISTALFCPTALAVRNLSREGIVDGVAHIGDVMLDASLHYRSLAQTRSRILERLGLDRGAYALATCHRAENTDDPARLEAIVRGLAKVARELPLAMPIHPRTRAAIAARGLDSALEGVKVIDPVPFLDMIRLEENARVIVTDSGGVQKEAFFFRVPCITLRDETEWVETLESGWNQLVPAVPERIGRAVLQARPPSSWPQLYGNGSAGQQIVSHLARLPG